LEWLEDRLAPSGLFSGPGNYAGIFSQHYLGQTVSSSGTFTWSGAGPDDHWTDSANWVSGVAPAPGDRLVFPQSAAQHTNTNDFTGDPTFYSIAFTGVPPQNTGYTLGGDAFTIGAGGIVDKSGDAQHAATDSITCDLSGTALNLTVTVASFAALELHGAISGAARLVKLGAGTLSLFGTNTYTNTTLIQQGALVINNAAALGSTAASAIVTPEGIVSLGSGVGSVAKPLILEPPAFYSANHFPQLVNMGGKNTWTGPIQIDSGLVHIGVAGQLTLSGTVSGVGGFRLDNPTSPAHPAGLYGGTLVLSGTNTYSGGTSVTGGVLTVQNSAALGALRGFGVSVSNATLQVQGGLSFAYNADLINGGVLESVDDGNTWAGPILSVVPSLRTIQADAGTFTVSGTISGRAPLHKTGEGELLLAGDNHTSGLPIEVDAGILRAQTANALGAQKNTVGSISVLDSATLELSGKFTSAIPATLAGSGVDNGGALRVADSGSTITLTGTITLSESSSIGTDAGTTLSVVGTIQGGPEAALDKVGSGSLVLAAANKYQGPTEIIEGAVAIGTSTSLGTGSEGTTILQGGGLALFGGSAGINVDQPLILDGQGGGPVLQLVNVLGNNTWSGPITLLSTSTVRIYKGQLSLLGTITGLGGAGLAKDGAGTLLLGGDHSSLGPLVVAGGGLTIAGSITATNVALPSSSTFTVVTFAPLVVSGNLTLGAKLALRFTGPSVTPIGTHIILFRKTSAGAAVGTFAGLPEGQAFQANGHAWRITYMAGTGAEVAIDCIG
jgi:autotransporter-associated beta strand protein